MKNIITLLTFLLLVGCASTDLKDPLSGLTKSSDKSESTDSDAEGTEDQVVSEALPEEEAIKELSSRQWPKNIKDQIEDARTDGKNADEISSDLNLPTQEELDAGRESNSEKIRLLNLDPTLYFGYNSDELTEDGQKSLQSHIAHLQKNPNLTIILEGHTDERGTREYNLSLGQKRSERTRQFLITFGLEADRIEALTYGEERPILEGHDENAWQFNRRVEIYYR